MLQECSHDATEQTLVSELVVPDASGSTVEENFIFGACRNTAKNVCSVDDCIHFVYRQDSSFPVR